ncbi:HupE/UreJ family protein [soil metagenome]
MRALFFKFLLAALIGLPVLALPIAAQAHKASDAYLQMQRTGATTLSLRWDIALRDLDAALDLDTDNDSRISWSEVKAARPVIESYALSHMQLNEGQCLLMPSAATGAPLEARVDGSYLVLRLQADCPALAQSSQIRLQYRLMAELDPTHRGLMKVERPGAAIQLLSLAPTSTAQTVDIGAPPLRPSAESTAVLAAPVQPVAPPNTSNLLLDGLHHILAGNDHLLFLICLLLPAVLTRSPRTGWQPVPRWQDAARPVLMTITMFTLAHSITLGLAASKLVTLSPRLIEPAIAVTIALAALDNLRPLLGQRPNYRYGFTFLFGLIHGFGFADVLAEMDLPGQEFLTALLQFNLGVELGQLLIVLPLLALLFAVRRWPVYARRLLPVGSAAALLIAAGWFVERVFDLGFMPV